MLIVGRPYIVVVTFITEQSSKRYGTQNSSTDPCGPWRHGRRRAAQADPSSYQYYGANATENITLLRTLAGPWRHGLRQMLFVDVVADTTSQEADEASPQIIRLSPADSPDTSRTLWCVSRPTRATRQRRQRSSAARPRVATAGRRGGFFGRCRQKTAAFGEIAVAVALHVYIAAPY